MSTAVAITSIAGHTVIVLAAIHYGIKGLALVMPQLRLSAPPKQEGKPGAADSSAAADAAADQKLREAA